MDRSFSPLKKLPQHFSRKMGSIALLLLAFTFAIAGFIIALPHLNVVFAATPTLNVIPRSAGYVPKLSITVKGFNYKAQEGVNIYWDYHGPGTGTLEVNTSADATGSFTIQFSPPVAPTNTYTIAGIGQTSGSIATSTFQLLPRLSRAQRAGGPGTKFTLFGQAFGAGETVNIYWNYTGQSTGTLLTTASADSTGSFTIASNVPFGTPTGLISIAGVGQSSHAIATCNITVDPPTLALAPLSGSANTALTLTTFGFQSDEKVNIYWNNSSTPLLVRTTNTFGYLSSTTINVPANTAPGSYPVKVVGQTTQISITNTFTVVSPGSNLDITSGPVGVSVSISGQGYAPGEAVGIYWNYNGPGTGIEVASVTAGSSGTISASFTVPTAANGAYPVAVVGITSNRVTQNTFTVGNGLAISPGSAPPGANVIVTGSGFQANESVDLHWNSAAGLLLATALADGNGNISQAVAIPSNAIPSSHSIVGIGQSSQQSFEAPITINTDWGAFGFDLVHHRQNYYENRIGTTNVANLSLKWTQSTARLSESSPVYANGIVYFTTYDGQLMAYNATTGSELWQFNPHTNFANFSAPAVDVTNNIVFYGLVGNPDYGLPSPSYALDAQTGRLIWSVILPWNEYAFPTIAFNTIYIGVANESGNDFMMALDELSGRVVWQHSTKGGIWGSAAVDSNTGTIFTGVGNPTCAVLALNAKTGALIWKYSVPNSGADDDVGAGIAIANGLVYASSKNGSVYALNESTGVLVWSTPIANSHGGDISSPAISANGIVYVGSRDKNLYALNATTGAVLWKTPTGKGIFSSPAIANGVVYFASGDKNIYAVDATNGNVLWNYTMGGFSYSSPIIANGWVYCASTDGNLYAFSL